MVQMMSPGYLVYTYVHIILEAKFYNTNWLSFLELFGDMNQSWPRVNTIQDTPCSAKKPEDSFHM